MTIAGCQIRPGIADAYYGFTPEHMVRMPLIS